MAPVVQMIKRNFQRNAGVLLLTDSVKSFIQTEAETTVVAALVFCNQEMEDEISGEMQVGSARMGKEDCGRKGTAKRMSRRSQRRYCKCAPNNLPKSLRMPKNIPMIPHSKRLHSRNRLINPLINSVIFSVLLSFEITASEALPVLDRRVALPQERMKP